MQRNNSQNFSKFYLPTGLATNSQELKLLQNKLLTNHYNTSQINYDLAQKSSKGLFNKSANFNPHQNEMTKELTLSSYDMLASNSSKQVKAALSNDLLQQMRIKNMKKMQEKQQVLNHQQILTKHTANLDALQKERQKQFLKKYKEQAKQDIKIKAERKRNEIAQHYQEQSYQKNRYTNGGDFIPRIQSLQQLKSSYANPTKDYYYQVDQAMRQRNQVVPNPEGMANNSSFKITRKNEQLKKLDFMSAGEDLKKSYQKQRSFYEGIRGEDMRFRNELKQTLISQIKQKEQRKKAQKIKELAKPYTNSSFQQIHHPINNPVDFRIAHDNKYVLGQLKSIQ